MEQPPADGGRRFCWPTPAALADRLGVSPTAVVVGLLVIVAAALGAWWALRPPPGPDPAETLPTVLSVPIPTPAPPTAVAEPERVVVDVVGEVKRPGLHELPAGSRVAHAVDAAGGLTDNADRMRLNLAEPLRDGSRLWVPAVGETEPPAVVAQASGTGGDSAADDASTAAPVNINSADEDALETLPGIGPVLAAAIVEHRRRAGPFTAVDELVEVSGIGPVKLEQIRALITVR